MHSAWLLLKRYLNREKRKLEQVLSFEQLHPFEKLGVLWLLDGEDEQQQVIQQVFDQSGLLKQIIHAQLLYKQQNFSEALSILEHSPLRHLNWRRFYVLKFIWRKMMINRL